MEVGDTIRIGEGNGTEIRVKFSRPEGMELLDVHKWYWNTPAGAAPLDEANKLEEFYSPTAKGFSLTEEQFLDVMEVLAPIYEEFRKKIFR